MKAKAQVAIAFDMIARANTVSSLSLAEMHAIVNRALDGEFDADLRDDRVPQGDVHFE